MKILVTDKIVDEGLEILAKKGYQVDTIYDLTPEELLATVAPYDALIVRSATQVTAEVIQAATNCKIIGRAGVTYDNIDVDAATQASIIVCNVPTANIVSTAEHAMALMLAAAREISVADESLHSGEWGRDFFMGHELYEKTLVIFGLGRIGGLVAERARAFGMRVVGYDPYCSCARARQLGVELAQDMNQALAIADFVSIHVPLTPETHHMLSANEFARMKNGVIIVNTARGGIIDEQALADFMDAGKVFACGIDMLEHEPSVDTPLMEFDHAVLTPHLGANTAEAQMRAGVSIARYIANGLEGLVVPTALNVVSAHLNDAVAAYVPACQMSGCVLSQLTGAIPTKVEIAAAGPCASDLQVLSAATLRGLLSPQGSLPVSLESVDATAARHGVKIDAMVSADARGYESIVAMESDGLEVSVSVVGPSKEAHIVSLLRYRLDVVPAEHALLLQYPDKPGQIGLVGTVLGEARVNISTMAIGRQKGREEVLAFINLDSEPADDVVDRLARVIDASHAWLLHL